jgi:hypothetical protein
LSQAPEPPVWGTEGPVQAEVFVLRLRHEVPELAGPCGPAPWYIEVGADDDPVEVVSRLSTNLMGPPLLVHSTSWRRDRGTVLLSFVVVIDEAQAPELLGVPITRAELARSAATAAPAAIAATQVIEHGLRHLSWLVTDDEVVRDTLSASWRNLLARYVPEPFRHLP